MARPEIQSHLQRLLTEEKIFIGSLFDISNKGEFFCSLYAPGDSSDVVLSETALYVTGSGSTPDDAVWAARDKLWKGL